MVQIPLCFLAKSLESMSLCHAAYFCKGWENARGCRIEHEAAKAYGLTIIYEDDNIAFNGSFDIHPVDGDSLIKIAKCKGVSLDRTIKEMVSGYIHKHLDMIVIHDNVVKSKEDK